MLPPIEQRIAAELGVRPQQVAAAVALLDEGATVPVHRALPQGGHRRARRHAAAHARRAPRLPARARGAPRGDPREHRRSRASSRRELRAEHRRRGDQAAPRGPVPAVQAQAPHQGADRARGRPRAARRRRCSPTRRSTRGRGREVPARGVHRARRREPRRARREGRARRRARRSSWSSSPRTPTLLGAAARAPARRGRHRVARSPRARRAEGAKFRDYFDYREPLRDDPVAPRAGAVPRPQRGDPAPRAEAARGLEAGAAQARRARAATRCERMIAARFGIADRGRPADAWLGRDACAGPGR